MKDKVRQSRKGSEFEHLGLDLNHSAFITCGILGKLLHLSAFYLFICRMETTIFIWQDCKDDMR